MNLKAYDLEENLCTCGDDANNTKNLKDMLQCYSSKHCNSGNYHVSPLQTEQCSSLGKGNAPNGVSGSIGDVHTNTETSFIPTTNLHTNTNTQKVRLDGFFF